VVADRETEWVHGDSEVVEWIEAGTAVGVTVLSAIPPGFDAYATIVVSPDAEERTRADNLLVETLAAHTVEQHWWLGYLETSSDTDLVDPTAPRVKLYAGWDYVLLQGEPYQALTARDDEPFRGALPDLVFPVDRSWLVSTLWDDDWRCIGGPAALIAALLEHAELEMRTVTTTHDMTPPGHVMR
jgi:hypothetical protein